MDFYPPKKHYRGVGWSFDLSELLLLAYISAESKEALNSVYQEDLEDAEEVATPESVDELRERLERMKNLMADRSRSHADKPRRRKNAPDVIDGNFLSVMFAFTLFIILVVSIYAFYNLFWAIWKRNARYHEEL